MTQARSSAEAHRNRGEQCAARPSIGPAAPAPFVAEHAPLLVPGRTLDLAAGSGRNAVFLAAAGHRVIAADVSRAALEGIRRSTRIDAVQVDLDEPCFRAQSLDNVVCINFLDRRLVAEIFRWLRPGGVLLLDTFLIDQRDLGHPRNPAFLLERNELLERLRGWRVLRYREGLVDDGGAMAHRAGAVAVRSSGVRRKRSR